jgi:hypothetical protein
MDSRITYDEAVKALNELYSSRTGKAYRASLSGDSEEERVNLLKQRIYEEKIWPVFINVLRIQTVKGKGRCDPADVCELQSAEIAEAVVKTAEHCLRSAEGEVLRRSISDLEDCSAYYDINTNQTLPFGAEDLFQIISRMERRFVWDVNSHLPPTLDAKHAFILGQPFDHEDSFWLRAQVKGGTENIYAFGVTELFGRHCLRIQRLRKNVVAALYKWRNTIPAPMEHYSSESRSTEVLNIIESFSWGKDRLVRDISDLRPYCTGSYHISVLAARRCAGLLLHEDAPKLKPKVDEEWEKFSENHPNALRDTQLIQNALYFNAEVLTRDEGAKQMAKYCGLKPVNEFLVTV